MQVYVAFGRDTGSGGGCAGLEADLPYGRGCSHLGREEIGGQRSLWPTERLGPRWRVVALPILPGFAGVERHHVQAMQLEQFNLGDNVPLYSRATSGDSVSLSPAAQRRLTVDSVGARQSAHRGGGVGTPRAGAARAAHHAAGAGSRSGESTRRPACGSAAAPLSFLHRPEQKRRTEMQIWFLTCCCLILCVDIALADTVFLKTRRDTLEKVLARDVIV